MPRKAIHTASPHRHGAGQLVQSAISFAGRSAGGRSCGFQDLVIARLDRAIQ
jgi:hypothetical protein